MRDVPELRDSLAPAARYGLVVGAPLETWNDVTNAGQASLLIDDNDEGIAPPASSPSTYVEDLHSEQCEAEQRFAWDLLAGRRLGGALAFFSRNLGADFADYENVPVVAAPTAGATSGRLMLWLRCFSCAIFPKPDGLDNVQSGSFGASVVVGIFADGRETLIVGSPTLGNGEVAILSDSVFRRWDTDMELDFDGMLNGVRECQCELNDIFEPPGNMDCRPWTERLTGNYPGEEFGAALAVADFDCDGVDDLAVGAPGAALPSNGPDMIPEAGAVYLYRSSEANFGDSLPTILRQGTFEVGGTPENGDRFGQTLVFGNFNGARRLLSGHSCYDLVVATPGEDDQAGELQVFEGSPNGITYGGPVIVLDDLFDLSSDPGDTFGFSLTAGDFDRDNFDDLAIGAPGDGVGGSVTVILDSPTGLKIDDATVIRQGGEFEGIDEINDQFGYSLTWTFVAIDAAPVRILVVGIPGETTTGVKFASTVGWESQVRSRSPTLLCSIKARSQATPSAATASAAC